MFRFQTLEYPDNRELLWITINFRLPEALYKRLQAKVEESKLSRSDLIRAALRQYLETSE